MLIVYFKEIKYFHFTNNRDETSSESRTSKISPILKGFDQFSKAVLPSYNISIDESIILFKGRSGMKIIIKGKPNPEGFRMFVAACPRTGYVYNCLFDDRHEWTVDYPQFGNLTTCVIYKLLSNTSNLQSEHAIVVENYYTTIELLSYALREIWLSYGWNIKKKHISRKSCFGRNW